MATLERRPSVLLSHVRIILASLAVLATSFQPVGAHAARTSHAGKHGHHTTRGHARGHHPRVAPRPHHARDRFTGYVVEGRTSTFGWLTGDSEGQTADGGTTRRPCIALYESWSLGHWFEVTIDGHHARLLHCDVGPAPWTGRRIDVTGLGDLRLGFSPGSFPTDSWGIARELR